MSSPAPAQVRVTVVTFRRPALLERALRSLLAQTHRSWIAEVLNDDPADRRPSDLIQQLGDPRIRLSAPPVHRGGTRNFNYAFRTSAEPFGSILEDDNWWEPEFLATMLAGLERCPAACLAVGNERIWREEPGGAWRNTGQILWPTAAGDRLYPYDPIDKCGGAKLCNSALLFRTAGAERWRTPETIPIDVTEHFRERVVPHPLLLLPSPLVNYAETLATHRSPDRGVWAGYQQLLVASVLALTAPPARAALAARLWQRARTLDPRLPTTLLSTGWFAPEARALWQQGRPAEKLRFLAGALRRPRVLGRLRSTRRRRRDEWDFLLTGAFAEFMNRSAHAAHRPT